MDHHPGFQGSVTSKKPHMNKNYSLDRSSDSADTHQSLAIVVLVFPVLKGLPEHLDDDGMTLCVVDAGEAPSGLVIGSCDDTGRFHGQFQGFAIAAYTLRCVS